MNAKTKALVKGSDPKKVSSFYPAKNNSQLNSLAKPLSQLHRTIGNRAVSGLLQSKLKIGQAGILVQRKTILKEEGIGTGTYVDKNTGSIIDKVLNASTILKPFIVSKLASTSISGNKFMILDDGTFSKRYTDYLKSINKSVGGPDPIKKILSEKWGFYDPKKEVIYLRQTSNFGSALHEAIHKFSTFNHGFSFFKRVFGSENLNEGVTQYFTDKVLEEQKVGKMKSHNYEKQLECAWKLDSFLSGQDPVNLIGRAYFLDEGDKIGAVLMKKNMKPLDFYNKKC